MVKGKLVAKHEYDVRNAELAWGHPVYGDRIVRRGDPDLGVLGNKVHFLVVCDSFRSKGIRSNDLIAIDFIRGESDAVVNDGG